MYSTNIGVFFNKETLNYSNVKLDSRKNYILNPFFSSDFKIVNKEEFDIKYIECAETISSILELSIAKKEVFFFNIILKDYNYKKENSISYKIKENLKYIVKKNFLKKYEKRIKKDCLNHFAINDSIIKNETKDYFILDLNISFYVISYEGKNNNKNIISILENILDIKSSKKNIEIIDKKNLN